MTVHCLSTVTRGRFTIAVLVPKKMGCCVCLEKEDADELYRLLHKVLGVLGKE